MSNKDYIKQYLLLELKKLQNEILEPHKIKEQRLREFIFYSYNEEIVYMLVDFIKDKELILNIVYCIDDYKIKPLAIYKLLILYYNLRFNEKENLSDKKPRYESQIAIKKQNFDNVQKYSTTDLSFDIPRRKSDLLYGFREIMIRYEFATDEEIRILLNIIGFSKLPRKPDDYKQLCTEWRINVVNHLNELSVKSTENINESVRTANQYQPTKE